jgi:hypothetical protein
MKFIDFIMLCVALLLAAHVAIQQSLGVMWA